MAIAPVAYVSGQSGADADTFTTSAIDTTGANLLVAAIATEGGAATISDSKGNTWNTIDSFNVFGSRILQLAYSVPSSVGSGHTFTVTGTDIFAGVSVGSYSGAHATPLGASSKNGTIFGSSLQPGSLTPSEDNMLLVTGLQYEDSSTPTINSSFTVETTNVKADFGETGSSLADQIQTSATARNPTWSGTNLNNVVMATFKQAAGGGGSPTNHFLGVLGVGN